MKLTSEESKIRRKEREKIKKKRRFNKNNERINEYKKDKCCSKCGYKDHPEILVFHHIQGDKSFEVSKRKDKSWESIEKEIEKCILLCPNCHSWLHQEERDNRVVWSAKVEIESGDYKTAIEKLKRLSDEYEKSKV